MNSFRSTLLALFLILSTTAVFAKEPIRSINGTVAKISDGDTIRIVDGLGAMVKVRLYGVDAPETEKSNRKTGRISKQGQPYGEEACRALQRKMANREVKVDVMAIDRYKRTVAVVWLGSRNINREMVKEGSAWAYRQYLDRPHASEYIEAEEQARKQRLGLWNQSNPQPPWEFRKAQRSDR